MDKKSDKLFRLKLQEQLGGWDAALVTSDAESDDIRNPQTKSEALRCQLTDEHVRNEKLPARTVHVRKYAALTKQGQCGLTKVARAVKWQAGASSDAEYPKPISGINTVASGRCAAQYRIMMNNKTLHPVFYNFQEQEYVEAFLLKLLDPEFCMERRSTAGCSVDSVKHL
jgi:hypothetical protein